MEECMVRKAGWRHYVALSFLALGPILIVADRYGVVGLLVLVALAVIPSIR
jgi:hypothetical protein